MELRRFRRFPLQCPIAISTSSHRGEDKIVNLSTSGCEVESNKSLQKGQELSVLLHLPDGKPPLEIKVALVRWSRGQQFGLKFLTMEPDQQARLRRFVSTLETGASHVRERKGEGPVEHRKHPRYQFQCAVWFPGKEESVAGTVSDLSTGGCKVMSLASLYIGMYLTLRVYLPGQEAALKIDQAVVRWAREEEFGLEFISMRPEEEERLRDVVSILEAGPSH